MSKSERVLEIAKEMMATEAQIGELRAKYERLSLQLKSLVGDEERTASPANGTEALGRGELPDKVLAFLRMNAEHGWAAGLIAKRVGGEPKAVQNILLRLAKPDDGRVRKISHGVYQFRSLQKGVT